MPPLTPALRLCVFAPLRFPYTFPDFFIVGTAPAGHETSMNYLAVALVGLCSGIIGGLFGVGGGILMVPAMIAILHIDPKMAIGTSLAVIIPTAIVSATTHFTMGNVNWKLAVILAPLAILGGYLGAKLTAPISAENLKRGFGILMIAIGIYMVLKPLGPKTGTPPPVLKEQS